MSSFDVSVYQQRLARAQELVSNRTLGGCVVAAGADLAYLTGCWLDSEERLTALVIPPVGTPVLVVPATDAGSLANSTVEGLSVDIRPWSDGENPHRVVAEVLGEGTIAVSRELAADHLLHLQDLCHQPFTVAGLLLSELFIAKDTAEIAQLEAAGAAIDHVHAAVPDLLRAGRTEEQVARDIEALILQEHSAVDFIIVGSGPNGANPHHSYSDRVIQEGDPVVIDIGGTYGHGYHSDCTRTYAVGETPHEFQKLYEVLLHAQQEARRAVHPGVTAAQIDHVARSIITEAGYGDAFFHRTGHGIGLSTHEEPFIMEGNSLVLQPGMTFSIEPGIYLRGRYGARIEDIVTVTADGCRSFNHRPHDLLTINSLDDAASYDVTSGKNLAGEAASGHGASGDDANRT